MKDALFRATKISVATLCDTQKTYIDGLMEGSLKAEADIEKEIIKVGNVIAEKYSKNPPAKLLSARIIKDFYDGLGVNFNNR